MVVVVGICLLLFFLSVYLIKITYPSVFVPVYIAVYRTEKRESRTHKVSEIETIFRPGVILYVDPVSKRTNVTYS